MVNVLVVGCGSAGARITAQLYERGHQVIVVDRDPESFRLLPDSFPEEFQRVGDATREEDLRRADIEQAQVLIAVTSKDATNAFIGQMAKHLFRVPRVVCLVNEPDLRDMYTSLGLEVISPVEVVSRLALEAVEGG